MATNNTVTRSNSFNEAFLSETYQDASTIITDLDKGLRSPNIGEQCEALVRFPKLFEKYPFPIVINSNFLKLAEFFRVGSNLFRLWVLRVCEQSEKHLEKITNVDEFVKRIFMVIHSNDPIARSLTLRILGSVACIIPEKQQVHHAIRRALDSHDTVEVEAAIYASAQFAEQSKTFAISMCSKVASMIESLQTPINMKLQLIPVLKYMYHDANTAALVKTLCINLLPKYPSENFICVTLQSLTELSCATLVDIPDQVNLLIDYLQDPRLNVRIYVLRSLQTLAEKGAHLWQINSVNNLISVAQTMRGNGQENSMMLKIILTLTKCPLIAGSKKEEGRILELCTVCFKTVNHKTSSLAIEILTSVVTYCYNEKISPPQSYLKEIHTHHEQLIMSSLKDGVHIRELTMYIKCGVQLAEKNELFAMDFTKLVGKILTDEQQLSQKQSEIICETLGALCSHFMKDKFQHVAKKTSNETMDVDEVTLNPFYDLLPSLLKRLENLVCPKFNQSDSHFIEILAAVCLQSMMGVHITQDMYDVFKKVLGTVNNWSQYRIARSASRFGHPFIATKIYQKLSKDVSQERYHFYLSGLSQISTAECILIYGYEFDELEVKFNEIEHDENQMNLIQRLEKSVALYWKALANLKAASSHIHSLSFQTEYVWLRASFLEALLSVVIARNTQFITPPPAIASTFAHNTRDPLQKFGHVTNQFRKCVKSLKVCEDSYSMLYKSAFDADPCSLEQLEIMQHKCALLGYSLENICFTTSQDQENLNVPTQGNYPETAFTMSICRKISREFEKLPQEQIKTITNIHTDSMLKQIEMAIKAPICIPRFFFQVQQNTSIKLSMSPYQRVAGEAILVPNGHNLVVKVEGVIQNAGAKPCLYRSIDSVQLTLTSQLLTPRPVDVKPINDVNTLVQITKPKREFLSANFLLSLNQPVTNEGKQWQVTLDANIIDENGVLWNTLGPKNTLIVRVPAENSMNTMGFKK
jgi:integrator complex subunit 7